MEKEFEHDDSDDLEEYEDYEDDHEYEDNYDPYDYDWEIPDFDDPWWEEDDDRDTVVCELNGVPMTKADLEMYMS